MGDCLSEAHLLVSSQCLSKPRGGGELNLGQGKVGGGLAGGGWTPLWESLTDPCGVTKGEITLLPQVP